MPAVVIDGGVVRDPVDPGGECNSLVAEEIEAREAAGHGVDGEILRVFRSAEASVYIVVDAVEVAFIKDAGRVLIAFPNTVDERAIVVGRRLSQFAHWVTLWAVPRSRGERQVRTSSRMVTL